ncbi:MAG TPA: amidohydrolase family protein [Gaiellaceae bacterium]|jgi:N-acetylglucosamine-6-phosphate deacetylase
MTRFAGVLVDPLDGIRPGAVVVENGFIAEIEEMDDPEGDLVVVPGFVDVHVYAREGLLEQGVTSYLLAARAPVEPPDERCLGVHLEGPFLNPEAAGAIPKSELLPVDIDLLDGWLDTGRVGLVTVSPELPGGLDAIAKVAARGAVAGIGHTLANGATTRAAIAAGARFATHLWNAMAPTRARATGPVPELLLDGRVVLGLNADGRHLHPRIEDLTVRVAGPNRVALTSDLVPGPAHTAEGTLLGGDRAGASLLSRMARFGLREAATMASLVPARLLGLGDRGRLAPGYRADLAILDADLRCIETVFAGRPVWTVRYPDRQ